MTRSQTSTGLAISLSLSVAVVSADRTLAQSPSQDAGSVSVYGGRLIDQVVQRPAWQYPAPSLTAKREGVLVAQVRVSPTGAMDTVEVLQAPDEHLAAAAKAGLMNWTFRPMQAPSGAPTAVRSKLVLYCLISDGVGTVRTAYEMKMPPAVGPPGVTESYPVIDEAAWKSLEARRPPPQLLDIRKRDAFTRSHLPGAINIPEDELTARSLNELSMSRPIVVDCPSETRDLCSYVERILQRAGFKQVSMLRRK